MERDSAIQAITQMETIKTPADFLITEKWEVWKCSIKNNLSSPILYA